MTLEKLLRTLRHATESTAYGYEVFEPVDLAKVVGGIAETNGLRQGPDGRVYRIREDGPPEEIDKDHLTRWIVKTAIWACQTYLANRDTGYSATLAKQTADVLTCPERFQNYVWRLRSRVIGWLDELDDEQVHALRAERAAKRAVSHPRRSARASSWSRAQYKADLRKRHKAEEVRSAAWWLRYCYLGDEDRRPAAGTRIPTAELARHAQEELRELVEEYAGDWDWFREDFPEAPERLRVPGSRHFHAVAESVLPKRRTARTTVYEMPKEERLMDGLSKLDALLLERTVETLANRFESRVLRILESQDADRTAATGTDGAVVDLVAAKARRSRRG